MRTTNSYQRSLTMSKDMIDKLDRYAAAKHISASAAARQLIENGLDLEMYKQGQTEIRKYIREEIETTLPLIIAPYMERLIKMQAKATRASSAALMTTSGLIAENYMDDIEPAVILAQAFKQAAEFMRTKPLSDNDYLEEAKKIMSVQFNKGQ